MKQTCALVVLVLGIASLLFVLRRPPPAKIAPEVAVSTEIVEADSDTTNTTLQQRLALMRDMRPIPQTNAPATPSTNLLAQLLGGNGEPPRISREQADAFASASGRRAEALLAAWRASGDQSFLREAMEKFPTDPHVAFMAWAKGGGADSESESARARSEWLEKFKQAAPQNALANYLSAQALLKAGDVGAALRELTSAQEKPWRDYTIEAIQNADEAYRAAGYSDAEAKTIASIGVLLPHLSDLRALGQSLNEVAASRRQSGDIASADAALQWALQLGQRTGQEGTMTLIQQLVAIAIQKEALKGLDPTATIGNDSLTVQQRLEVLNQQRESIRQVARESAEIMPRLSEEDLGRYFERLKLFGEQAAVQWARARVRQN